MGLGEGAKSCIISLESGVISEGGINDSCGGRFKDWVLRHLPVHILVVHLELGQLTAVIDGDDEFVDKEEDQATQHDARNHAEDDVEDACGLGAFALAYNLQVNL